MQTKRYRYRVYPNSAQREQLSRAFGCSRTVYNDFIAARQAAYEAGLPAPTTGELSKRLVTEAKKTPERAWLADVSAVMLQQAVRDADRSYRRFHARIAKKTSRYYKPPKFRSAKAPRQSIKFLRTGNGHFRVKPVNRNRAHLTLPRITGPIPMAWSRPLPSEPTTVSILREGDGRYYASFVVRVPKREAPTGDPARHAALDLGLDPLAAIVYTDGTRETIANPKYMRRAQCRLRAAQRAMDRKEPGSKNREKARTRLATHHRKVREARRDHHHKLSTRLIRENQTVAIEGLHLTGLLRSGGPGWRGRARRRAINDAGWGQLIQLLHEKAADHDRQVITVSPYNTTRACSICGTVDAAKPLGVRTWTCPTCGTRLHRDYNAALNILVAAGQAETLNACGEDIRLTLASAGLSEARTTPERRSA